MSELFNMVKEEVERTNELIRRDMPTDQGTAANSLHVEVVGNKINSVGSSYIEYLDRGSAPWSDPTKYRSLGYMLEKNGWADRHDINAYAAAFVIAHKGSQIYQGRKKGIELDKKLIDLRNRISGKIPNFVKTQIQKTWQ